MRHDKLTIETKRSGDLEVRSDDRFSRPETESILQIPGVNGVFAPTPRRLMVGVIKSGPVNQVQVIGSEKSNYESEAVKVEIIRILRGGAR